MKDKNGKELEVGDKVTILCIIDGFHADDDSEDADRLYLLTDEPLPEDGGKLFLELHSSQVVKVDSPEQFSGWKPASQSETKTKGAKTMDDPIETKTISLAEQQADFEKIASSCSTFRDNYGMVRDGEMTEGNAAQRGWTLIGQILEVVAKHKGHEYFDRIGELSHLANPRDPKALEQVLILAESKGSLPGGIAGEVDVDTGQTGSGAPGGVA